MCILGGGWLLTASLRSSLSNYVKMIIPCVSVIHNKLIARNVTIKVYNYYTDIMQSPVYILFEASYFPGLLQEDHPQVAFLTTHHLWQRVYVRIMKQIHYTKLYTVYRCFDNYSWKCNQCLYRVIHNRLTSCHKPVYTIYKHCTTIFNYSELNRKWLILYLHPLALSRKLHKA